MKKYLSSHIPECISLFLYVVLRIVNAFFHEPWYDEAFAWQIARVADWKTIILVEPKYEGHPPLWHMVLALFAKSGAHYEVSLAIISLLFTTAAVALILFKSPFPRLVKILLPFTYFIFFQYGVISRPYCMMMLAFSLSAVYWKERRARPFRLTFSLFFLCLTSLYGIAFAGGIAMAWAFEYIAESKSIKDFFTGKRFPAMLTLLIAAIAVLVDMIPDSKATPVSGLTLHSYLFTNPLRFLYLLFALPADSMFTDAFSMDAGIFLRTADFKLPVLILSSFAGLLIMIGIIAYGYHKKTALLFLLPQSIFILIASFYFSQHHVGVDFLFILFWIWASMNEPEGRNFMFGKDIDLSGNKIINYLHLDKPQKIFFLKIPAMNTGAVNLYNVAAFLFASVTLVVSLSWCFGSFSADLKYNFACGRYMAGFIREHNLEDRKILSHWRIYFDKDGKIERQNTCEYLYANNLLPYFERNIFYNYRNGDDSLAYELRVSPTAEDNKASFAEWRKNGFPDVILNSADLGQIFPEVEKLPIYTTVYMEDDYTIWKGRMSGAFAWLSVRDDLLEELGFDRNAPLTDSVFEYEYGKPKKITGGKARNLITKTTKTN